jgi:hypothetical protein
MTERATIYSIYGQIEEAAAKTMCEQHGIYRIEPRDFPEGVPKIDDDGQTVVCALLMTDTQLRIFRQMVRNLYA